MNENEALKFSDNFWTKSAIAGLSEFIRVPSISPAFDENWQSKSHLLDAIKVVEKWMREQKIKGLTMEVLQLNGKTPLLYAEIAGNNDAKQTVLFYCHLDKMPESSGWDEGLGPWQPVLRDEHLFGRGSVDNGYAIFAFIGAIKLLQELNLPHARCVILAETDEESGSSDMPYYLDHLQPRIGVPQLVVCLDNICYGYDRLWNTTSMRGMVCGTLQVEVLKAAVHSGTISGIIPSGFRILRQLLSRIEDENSGEILLNTVKVNISKQCIEQAQAIAQVLGDSIYKEFPLIEGIKPLTKNSAELLLNRTWRAFLSVTGANGFPAIKDASNALRPLSALQLSLRVPPLCEPDQVTCELKTILETNPPYDAQVSFTVTSTANGWAISDTDDWLKQSTIEASNNYFHNSSLYAGGGESIGVIYMLIKAFPDAQFFNSGLAGPGSNEHGPNESLYLLAAKKMTCCVAHILAKQVAQSPN